ncbi:MAG: hypothetical protein HY914_10310 [Desulfomonile tiedjei]|nr:hypothetical protein [Desulfomonile tiedjei]
MSRWLLFFVTITVTLCAVLSSQAEDQRRNLVPAKRAAEIDAQAVQQARPATANGQPTAADQLYVFWALGKLISYPFDAADAYIQRYREGSDSDARAVPAAAPGASNPFDAVKLGQIPPAPPVSSRPSWEP